MSPFSWGRSARGGLATEMIRASARRIVGVARDRLAIFLHIGFELIARGARVELQRAQLRRSSALPVATVLDCAAIALLSVSTWRRGELGVVLEPARRLFGGDADLAVEARQAAPASSFMRGWPGSSVRDSERSAPSARRAVRRSGAAIRPWRDRERRPIGRRAASCAAAAPWPKRADCAERAAASCVFRSANCWPGTVILLPPASSPDCGAIGLHLRVGLGDLAAQFVDLGGEPGAGRLGLVLLGALLAFKNNCATTLAPRAASSGS